MNNLFQISLQVLQNPNVGMAILDDDKNQLQVELASNGYYIEILDISTTRGELVMNRVLVDYGTLVRIQSQYPFRRLRIFDRAFIQVYTHVIENGQMKEYTQRQILEMEEKDD